MNIVKALWTILTSSKGIKRNVGITMIALAVIAGKIGIDLPADIESQVEEFLKWIGGGVAFWGVLANLYQQWKSKKDAKIKAKVIKQSEFLRTADSALKNMLLIFALSAICFSASAGILSNIVSPAPARDSAQWVLQLEIPVGIIGITKSNEPGRQVDARVLNCVGFGPSYQRQVWTGRNYTTFAVTLAALFFPQVNATAFPYDFGGGLFATAFNGYGGGIFYNAGYVSGKTINRIGGMIIYGVGPWKNK